MEVATLSHLYLVLYLLLEGDTFSMLLGLLILARFLNVDFGIAFSIVENVPGEKLFKTALTISNTRYITSSIDTLSDSRSKD